MQPDRDRAFTKRGATAGVTVVAAATLALFGVAALIAAVLQLAF